MPLYYDVTRQTTTNGSGNTKTTHIRAATVANQETVRITGVFADIYNSSTVGSGFVALATNTGSAPSGGGPATVGQANIRITAAASTWNVDTSTITAGGTLLTRVYVGLAQTGGQNGWVPIEPAKAIQMMPNATNPVSSEFFSQTTTASQALNVAAEFCEGT